jgi:hypothetical protein
MSSVAVAPSVAAESSDFEDERPPLEQDTAASPSEKAQSEKAR